MDNLSKLGFLCAELLLRNNRVAGRYRDDETGIVIANAASSLDTDIHYQDTIRGKAAYFPSPSVFVYTLPNIVIGEICIRHKLNGENAFLVMEGFDADVIRSQVAELLDNGRAKACLCGWVEILENRFESVLFFVEKEENTGDTGETDFSSPEFTTGNLTEIYKKQG